jgi:CTD kinase subunit beta
MTPQQNASSSSRSGSSSDTNGHGNAPAQASNHVKLYRPYFSPAEIEQMSAKQRGKLSVNREERLRQQACGFIDAVGVRCGL